jgi:hypothetical protein
MAQLQLRLSKGETQLAQEQRTLSQIQCTRASEHIVFDAALVHGTAPVCGSSRTNVPLSDSWTTKMVVEASKEEALWGCRLRTMRAKRGMVHSSVRNALIARMLVRRQ